MGSISRSCSQMEGIFPWQHGVMVTALSYGALAVCASRVAGLAQAQQLRSGEGTEEEGQLPAETPFGVICSLSW